MNPNRLSLAIAVLILPLAAAQAEPIPKQLAGAPSEFAAMQLPDPAAAAIHSKSALLPVEFGMQKNGTASWRGELPVESGQLRFLLFAGEQQPGWTATLVAPDGRRTAAATMAKAARTTEFGSGGAAHPAQLFTFDGLAKGRWTLEIEAPAGAPRSGYLLLEGDASTELASYQTHRRQKVGERIGVAAVLTSTSDDAEPISIGHKAGRISDAALRVTTPDGRVANYPMFDDGRHDDGAAGDGVFGGQFLAKAAGSYVAQVVAHGRNRSAQPIVRTAEHVIPVVEATLSLAADRATATLAKSGRYTVELPVAVDKAAGDAPSHVRVFAEVWGRDAKGVDVPVAWIGGMSDLSNGRLSLGLDQRWVVQAGAAGPFELRKLRIEEPDHFVSLTQAERLPLALPAPRSKLRPSEIVVDDAMRMGERPADLKLAKGTGSRLLLVHGYCSGGVWPTSHFSNASTFLDANQNRSHDQFARLIQSFGSTWNSFGTVAHSQGGAASLHLYTYYWSGLDNAGAGRLIQSVGTPYQGTNLSGILAALGSWFGVGCGTNDNMTYSGASAWLSGIPTWARSKVNFYTTSFRKTNWWTNDYCNFATDVVLSDPEDGTTEKAYGQLSGAVNRGHVSGQCHTAGMRDPAQYHDANRNSIMNSNAAR